MGSAANRQGTTFNPVGGGCSPVTVSAILFEWFCALVLIVVLVAVSQAQSAATSSDDHAANSAAQQVQASTGNQTTLSYWVDPTGSDSNPGSQSAPFKTLGKAWSVAQANNLLNEATTVNINSGTYRESIQMNAEPGATSAVITFKATTSGNAIWSGGELYTGWTVYSGNSSIYTHTWTNNYPLCAQVTGCTQYLQEEIMLHQEMVTVNGSVLTQVLTLGQMLYPGSFYVDNTHSTIYVWPPSGTNMSTAAVDIPSQSALLTINNVSYLTFKGIVFQYANSCRSSAAVTVNNGSYITFDTDTFQWNNGQGISIDNPASNITVKNSVSDHNGDSGFQSSQTLNMTWTSNTAEYNNWRGAQAAYYNCNVAGQHVWMEHSATMTNVTVAWNQTWGIHWDTDNRNISGSGLIAADNLLSGMFVEKNEGPISFSSSYVCNQTSTLSSGGLRLDNSGYDKNSNAATPGFSLTNSYLYNNYPTQIVIDGAAGGVTVTDWQTNKNYKLVTGNVTNTGNVIEGVGSGQQVFTDNYLDGLDWTDFYTTLKSDNNDWYNSSNTTTAFGVPTPIAGTATDFTGWQATSLQDLSGSSFAPPSGNPFTACTSVAAPVKKAGTHGFSSSAADYWLTVDNNSVTANVTGTAVYNLTVTSLQGFTGTVNLSLDGITEVAGLSATLSASSIKGGAGTSVLTVTDTVGTTPAGNYSIAVIANNGNLTRTVTVELVVSTSSLLFSALDVSFPDQEMNTTSAALSVTITNKGAKSVTFTSYTVTPTQFAISKNTCPASGKTLGAGKNCTVSLTFTPNAVQLFTGTLTIVDSDISTPQVVNLSGTGTGMPAVTLSSYNLNYGDVLKNTSSSRSFTLTNTGAGNLTISSVSITGADKTMFTETNNCPSPVLPNGVCTFTVTFTPTNTVYDSATVTIYDNTTMGSQSVALSGTGKLPTVSFTPGTLAFGNVQVGYSSTLSDTIKNTSDVALTMTKFSLTGTDPSRYSIVTNTCPMSPNTLAAGFSCSVTITFTPNSPGGTEDASLTISDNVSSGSSVLNLTGSGKYATASLTPGSYNYGTITKGTSKSETYTLTNNSSSGAWTLTISSITVTGTNKKDFAITTNTCGSSLAQNASCSITVQFTPSTTSSESATLTVNDNTSAGSNTSSLSGTGK